MDKTGPKFNRGIHFSLNSPSGQDAVPRGAVYRAAASGPVGATPVPGWRPRRGRPGSERARIFMVGASVKHYKILRKLGEGGMGEVFLARDKRLDREVALKTLPRKWSERKSLLKRFQREARTLAQLNHPNIVTIHSVEESRGTHFLTMEYIEGRTLAEVMAEGPLPMDRFLDLSIPLADALSAAHERGVTHCDLKPANIMLSHDGRIKVLDFGLAKLRHGDKENLESQVTTEPVTVEGMIKGTAPYMSPEQVQGLALDHRSDIFSLGIILYELAVGRRPFQGDTVAVLMSSILKDNPPSVQHARPDLPAHLGHVLGRCLAKEPQRRLQTTLDLKNELEVVRRELKPGAERTVHSIAVLPFVDMSPERDQDYFCEGMAEEIINALAVIDGLRVTSRTSAFQFKGESLDSRKIGELLSVDTLVEGSVRKAGQQLRITAQLINVSDGYQRWSRRYDREMKDVFSIQEEIAQHIVQTLRFASGPRRTPPVHKPTTDDVQAYDYYLRGRKYFYQLTRRGLEFARQMFTQASKIDPSYALSYAGIADSCSFMCMWFDRSDELLRQADAASRMALELAPDLGEAHASRGLALSLNREYEESEQEFEIAIHLNPKLYEAYYFFGRDLVGQGKLEKAASMFVKANDARPEDYQSLFLASQCYRGLKQFQAAEEAALRGIATAERTLELNPEDTRALYLGAAAMVIYGQKDRGLEWAQRAANLDPENEGMLYQLACIHSLAGEVEEAISYLEEWEKRGAVQKEWAENDTDLDALRDHPRFQALLARLP